jgi:hypothetical protein
MKLGRDQDYALTNPFSPPEGGAVESGYVL